MFSRANLILCAATLLVLSACVPNGDRVRQSALGPLKPENFENSSPIGRFTITTRAPLNPSGDIPDGFALAKPEQCRENETTWKPDSRIKVGDTMIRATSTSTTDSSVAMTVTTELADVTQNQFQVYQAFTDFVSTPHEDRPAVVKSQTFCSYSDESHLCEEPRYLNWTPSAPNANERDCFAVICDATARTGEVAIGRFKTQTSQTFTAQRISQTTTGLAIMCAIGNNAPLLLGYGKLVEEKIETYALVGFEIATCPRLSTVYRSSTLTLDDGRVVSSSKEEILSGVVR